MVGQCCTISNGVNGMLSCLTMGMACRLARVLVRDQVKCLCEEWCGNGPLQNFPAG
jgi:hypothetical protein